MTVTLYHGDCLEIMKSIPDKSIDAVITDPPYNIGKAEWDKIKDYVGWCGKWITECQRVLKDNGSFYFFHNDMEQIADLMLWIRNNTRFIFKQMIVWDKYNGSKWNQLNALVFSEGLKNYPKQAEYCLFYTFQDETGLTTVKLDMNNFSTLRQYFKDYQEALGLTKPEILEKIGQQADHCFRWGSSQWDMPTEETYNELEKLPINNEFVRREYEDLRQEYESLRQEYESLRYTFNNQNVPSVWNFTVETPNGHITPKPVELLERIIKTSSNENYAVLDPFMGSGTTGVACVQTGRNFIGIEIDEGYFKIAEKRIKDAQQQMRLPL